MPFIIQCFRRDSVREGENIKEYYIHTSELSELGELNAGDKVYLSGVIYTARDAAHKILCEIIQNDEVLPFALNGGVIYYAGPTPTPPGKLIGSCGPTTSGRMDKYAPMLLDKGLLGMIGKGDRNADVYEAIIRNGAIYFCALGGGGAIASKCIQSARVIAFEELGCEAVRAMEIKNFPLIVGIDCKGNSVFI